MNFSRALELFKVGVKMERGGWNGNGMFAYYVPPQKFKTTTEIAKKEFGESVQYNGYFALKTVNGSVSAWSPNNLDILADDWQIAK